MLQKEPYVYIITKVDNTSPKGIIAFTVKQDRFEPDHDFVGLDPLSENYGDMYADYYSSDIEPGHDEKQPSYRLVIHSSNYNVRLGTSKVLTAKIYDAYDNEIIDRYPSIKCIWNFNINDGDNKLIVVDDEYGSKPGNEFKCKFKFNGDEKYIDKNIYVTCQFDEMIADAQLDIIAL